MTAALDVVDLKKSYPSRRGKGGVVNAVNSISFSLEAGQSLAIVGESGCGKSTVGKMIADVLEPTSGEVRINGTALGKLRGRERNRLSLQVQLIHQDPYAALNPVRTIWQSLSGPFRVHRIGKNQAERRERLERALEAVGLTPGSTYLEKYPHQLSGGQRQRIVVARALSVAPGVLVADEATSMVDVSLRVDILKTIKQLQRESGVATVFITHDFGVARYFAEGERVAVMYNGRFVEIGKTEDVIGSPRHPYTLMLLTAIPTSDPEKNRTRTRLLPIVDEHVGAFPTAGCPFAPRCPMATQLCRDDTPQLRDQGDGHRVACHYPERVEAAAIEHGLATLQPRRAEPDHPTADLVGTESLP
ncbi:ABC transporter ATP-binding protein [Microbacterium sp. BWT-B31]|uniref:ABC transporter ATP-binding protein n=1 Tax=Microbacterium sp. BWT-B31 TaxID=3232072 RepID=UPI003529CDD5